MAESKTAHYTRRSVQLCPSSHCFLIQSDYLNQSATLLALYVTYFYQNSTNVTQAPASDIIEYHDVHFNGTLTHPSPYKGPPSQEVDQRWDNIAMLEPFGVSERTIRGLGKDPAKAVKMPDGEKYLASVEVIHQLHCLVSNTFCEITLLTVTESDSTSIEL